MNGFKIRLAAAAAALFIFGAVMLFTGISDTVKMNGTVPDFNYDSMQNLKKGDIVQGYVENIIDCYASETTTEKTLGIETSSRTSGEYFIMPLINETDQNSDLYITVTAKNAEDRKNLNDICDITWEYLNGNTDVEWIDMPIVAKVKPLDNELHGYMIEWFRNAEWFDFDGPASDAEIDSHIVRYELVIYRVKTASDYIIVGIVLLLSLTVIAVVSLARAKRASGAAEDFTDYTPPQSVSSDGQSISGSFSENRSAPEPMPYIPQPVQPDEFFADTHKRSASGKTVPEAADPAEESVPAPVPDMRDMDALDTSAVDFSELGEEHGDDDGAESFTI